MGDAVRETVRVNDEIPEGMSEDARASWPPRELIDSFLGSFPGDFELRPLGGLKAEVI